MSLLTSSNMTVGSVGARAAIDQFFNDNGIGFSPEAIDEVTGEIAYTPPSSEPDATSSMTPLKPLMQSPLRGTFGGRSFSFPGERAREDLHRTIMKSAGRDRSDEGTPSGSALERVKMLLEEEGRFTSAALVSELIAEGCRTTEGYRPAIAAVARSWHRTVLEMPCFSSKINDSQQRDLLHSLNPVKQMFLRTLLSRIIYVGHLGGHGVSVACGHMLMSAVLSATGRHREAAHEALRSARSFTFEKGGRQFTAMTIKGAVKDYRNAEEVPRPEREGVGRLEEQIGPLIDLSAARSW